MSNKDSGKNLEVVDGAINIYTDGSAITKGDRNGGWSVYFHKYNVAYRGGMKNTTISRMEMWAMLKALYIINKNHYKTPEAFYKIYCDNQMVVRSINLGWLNNWVRERFVNRVNADIWKPMHYELEKIRKSKINVEIIHIRGHQKDLNNQHVFGNHVADRLASYKQYL